MIHRIHLQGVPREHAPIVKRAILLTLTLEDAAPGGMTLRLADDAELRRLNAQYAGADRSTDVLSFPDGEPDAEGPGVYFGDVAIGLPAAEAQARAAGHDLQSELVLLAIHGTLHLLGHDHADGPSQEAMWRRQDRILAEAGCSIRSPHTED